jgi:hypothetical protein
VANAIYSKEKQLEENFKRRRGEPRRNTIQ